jgi:hypothetical protein
MDESTDFVHNMQGLLFTYYCKQIKWDETGGVSRMKEEVILVSAFTMLSESSDQSAKLGLNRMIILKCI